MYKSDKNVGKHLKKPHAHENNFVRLANTTWARGE